MTAEAVVFALAVVGAITLLLGIALVIVALNKGWRAPSTTWLKGAFLLGGVACAGLGLYFALA